MLGTNDFQCTHNNNAWISGQGILKIIQIILEAPIEPGMPIPEIMVVSPPPIRKPIGAIADKFKNSEIRSLGLADQLEKVSSDQSVLYFDAATVTEASIVDGIHLDEDQHELLGKAIANAVHESNIL